ncbi:hypothetical protein L1987_26011 [Smallanthus sonchifolius]|uniref:Uncharacterized protein n=1 Tax=Smallanthus sonchifolius TaxID=185202 RepID=A0ACB9IAD3_9ASTR|nr:hypothetical protein L1987_26011 [Smallanthus sonchifolius]
MGENETIFIYSCRYTPVGLHTPLKQLQGSLSPRRSATSCGIIRLSTKMGDVAKDLASGTLRGVAQLVVGHPFDTIKVKLQSQPTLLLGQLPKYSGAMDWLKWNMVKISTSYTNS